MLFPGFYIGWMRGMLVYGNSLSLSLPPISGMQFWFQSCHYSGSFTSLVVVYLTLPQIRWWGSFRFCIVVLKLGRNYMDVDFPTARRRANGLIFTFVDTRKHSLFFPFSFQHGGLLGTEGIIIYKAYLSSIQHEKLSPIILLSFHLIWPWVH